MAKYEECAHLPKKPVSTLFFLAYSTDLTDLEIIYDESPSSVYIILSF